MAWLPTSAGTAGRVTCENVLAEGLTLEKYAHPDWDDEPEVSDYIHALVTSAGHRVSPR